MRSTALASCLLAACALTTVACSPVAPILPSVQHPDAAIDEPSPDVSKIPPRPQRPLTGSVFVRTIAEEDEAGRERAVLREISRGNLPDTLRHLSRVEFQATAQSGATHTVTLWAMPDYLSIGSDADHLRMPMSPVTAQIIADTFGFLLPTAKIVDTLHAHAATRLAPRPLAPTARMVHPDEFAHHDRLIEEQLGATPRDQLLAGHKKDVVLSNKLSQRPHRVAIYGWHELDSHPIQPLSTLHGDWYSDYSHGIRLISALMLLDGKPMQVADALTDPELAPLLSDEGPLLSTRYRTQEGVGKLKWWPKPEVPEAPETPETPTTVAIR